MYGRDRRSVRYGKRKGKKRIDPVLHAFFRIQPRKYSRARAQKFGLMSRVFPRFRANLISFTLRGR